MRTVIITGAAGGMGNAVCKKFRRNGYRVFAIDIKPVENINQSENFKSVICDITDSESVKNAAAVFKSFSNKLDGIIHTAGIYDLDSLTEIDEERFLRIFQINLFGVFRINKQFTPLMHTGARITVVTSELAPLDPLPFTGIYAITKSALEKYAHSLRTELSLRGISVSVIRPGAVNTGLLNVSQAALEKFCANTKYYKPNAARFKKIVDSVESKSVTPDDIAVLAFKSQTDADPKYVYNINRNPLLLLLSALPDRIQQIILKEILKK